MKFFHTLARLLCRIRYPISMPEEIADALGIPLSNFLPFEHILKTLTNQTWSPTKLTRWMPRRDAESVFQNACKSERFREETRVSYYFTDGCLAFVLYFDPQGRLRRLFVQHRLIPSDKGCEIELRS